MQLQVQSLPPRPDSANSRVDLAVGASLALISFAILFPRYWFPPSEYFDEVYFARAAREYIHRQYIYENTHPPVTKLLITLSTILFGDNSHGWRFLDVVFGSAVVWLLFLFLRRITGSTLFAAYGAGLLMVDGMHYVQSRIATPESFVAFFALATLYTFYRYWNEERPQLVGVWGLLFAISAGLLVASKWYGVMTVGVTLALFVVSRGRRSIALLATVLVACALIYFASYTPQFIGLSDAPKAAPRAYSVKDILAMQYNAFEYHAHLKQTHRYQSRWWQWPVDLRPILYYADYKGAGTSATAAMIYTLPNPLILWLGLLTVPFVGYLAARERNKAYILIVLTYLAQWLPWMWSPRISFAYHFYVDIPLICACTAITMQRLWIAWRSEKARPAAGIIAFYFVASAMAFVYFFPILSGIPIPTHAWLGRMWLRSWI